MYIAHHKKLSQNNLLYFLSFSLTAPTKNQLHSPLCARFLFGAVKEKSCELSANYFTTVPKKSKSCCFCSARRHNWMVFRMMFRIAVNNNSYYSVNKQKQRTSLPISKVCGKVKRKNTDKERRNFTHEIYSSKRNKGLSARRNGNP